MVTRAYLTSTLGHLGPADEARAIWRELMEINRKYSYVEHVGRLPFKNPADTELTVESLRKAGLAE
jgi:adenylate cyclase